MGLALWALRSAWLATGWDSCTFRGLRPMEEKSLRSATTSLRRECRLKGRYGSRKKDESDSCPGWLARHRDPTGTLRSCSGDNTRKLLPALDADGAAWRHHLLCVERLSHYLKSAARAN